MIPRTCRTSVVKKEEGYLENKGCHGAALGWVRKILTSLGKERGEDETFNSNIAFRHRERNKGGKWAHERKKQGVEKKTSRRNPATGMGPKSPMGPRAKNHGSKGFLHCGGPSSLVHRQGNMSWLGAHSMGTKNTENQICPDTSPKKPTVKGVPTKITSRPPPKTPHKKEKEGTANEFSEDSKPFTTEVARAEVR